MGKKYTLPQWLEISLKYLIFNLKALDKTKIIVGIESLKMGDF